MAEVAWGWWVFLLTLIALPLVLAGARRTRLSRAMIPQDISPARRELKKISSRQSANDEDEVFLSEMKARLIEHPDIDAARLDIYVKNGHVAITGKVSDEVERRLVHEVVSSVPGVKSVENHVIVLENEQGRAV